MPRFGSVALIVVGLLLGSPTLASVRWLPTAGETAQLGRSVDSQWAQLFGGHGLPNGATGSSLASFALNGLAIGYRPERVAQAIEALAAMQDTEPSSPTYGNVRWSSGESRVVDQNGVEFTTRHMALAWLLYNKGLTDAERKPLVRLLDLARAGLDRHQVSIRYTNIFLMKCWNLIALGQVFHDPRLSDMGRSQLAEWVARAQRSGVDEYLSPTYYAVDLENLALIYNLADDKAARDLARSGLDIIWRDVAVFWFSPGERLGGPHSRDYDRLTNQGLIDGLAARAGWPARAGEGDRGPYVAYAYAAPSAAAVALLKGPLPRFITERVGEEPENRISAYAGQTIHVGSANFTYGPDDDSLVVNLGAGHDVPTISAFMDGRGDHYGLDKTLEASSGHLKSFHLKPFVASVQNGPEVLYVASAKENRPDLSEMETTVILPADADYLLNGKPLDVFRSVSRWRNDPAPIKGETAVTVVRGDDGRTELSLSDRTKTAGIGVSQRFPVTQGDTFAVSAELAGGPVALYLNFEGADGQLIGSENIKPVVPGAAFQRFSFRVTAPSGAVNCKAWLYSSIESQTELRVRDLAVDRTAAGESSSTRLASLDFKEFRGSDIVIPTGSTLIVRRKSAAVAIRPLLAAAVDGQPVTFHLINDGLAVGALRMTAVHAESRTNGRGTAALWVLGGDNLVDAAAFAAFETKALAVQTRATSDGNVVDIGAVGGTAPMSILADVRAGRRLRLMGGPAGQPDAADRVMQTQRWLTE